MLQETMGVNTDLQDCLYDGLKKSPSLYMPGFSGTLAGCFYDPAAFHDGLFRRMGIPIPDSLKHAVCKRKMEFLAGRYCALQALAQEEVRQGDLRQGELRQGDVRQGDLRQEGRVPVQHIPIGQHRQPLWPQGVVGAITHSQGVALAAVSTTHQGVGLDFEYRLSEATGQEVQAHIISPKEALRLEDDLPGPLGLTLAFSSKESLFKALFPQVGCYFDFREAELIAVSPKRQRFQLQLLRTLSPTFQKGRRFEGVYRMYQGGVCTLIHY